MTNQSKARGASLIIVMLILIVVSIVGVGGIQIATLAERATRSDRDKQIAWQATEAGLLDAEFDILGLPASSGSKRDSIFKLKATDVSKFISGCGNSGNSRGLCAYNPATKPAWLTVDFEATGNSASTTPFGTFTERTFPSGSAGIQPAKPPRYIIEPIPDPSYSRTEGPENMRYIYRVTVMGFGPNPDTQTMLQMIYRN
ncbi:pilus assembly PilX family protein [Paracidovorax konjaci]|uniref:Type IV pilus assembly protein PilX n=1 Tax=Paracidovorax konjaci TaxID=32040 RepID=A0A1I1XT04_9BURK|nr:PilX N-terminal domain-containing pilus assembly protein [Paracidovorax konjaci]SFE10507.1 type IV pilus assembly protein PilX [Paracidovorax konjaci]